MVFDETAVPGMEGVVVGVVLAEKPGGGGGRLDVALPLVTAAVTVNREKWREGEGGRERGEGEGGIGQRGSGGRGHNRRKCTMLHNNE